MTPVIDYSTITERNFDPAPEGEYLLTLDKWNLVEKSGKYPYYNLEYSFEDEKGEKKKVWDTLSLHPDALSFWKQAMIALGCNSDDVAPGSTTDSDDVVRSVVAGKAMCVLAIEDYESKGEKKSKNVIKRYRKYELPF